ncbi:unnamed protein product, partial [Sphagnum balticum]
MVFNPSKNMVMDKEENLLVHYFCKLDYAEGVQYILEKSAWGFEPERDLPYLSLLCVTEESLKTLQYFAASWPQTMKKQLLLLHKACMCNNEEVFRLLLLDVGIDFDTWEEFTLVGGVDSEPEGTKQKPMHKLAAPGKTEMLKQEVVSSGNESQATGLGSQSKQLYQEKSASEGEAYAQRILSGFETGSAPEEVISIHYNIDFPHELSVECCKRGYFRILQFLEDCGLNLSPNPQVLWDLHITAVQYGHINVADFLLQRGFSVNSSDGSSAGWSPLQWACESSHMDPRKKKEMVSFLLKKGADPNYTSNGGYTSMDIA